MRKKNDIAEKLEKLRREAGITLPVFSTKKASEIKERPKVLKGPTGKPIPQSIKDLTIPESAFELFTIEVTTDPHEERRAMQLLGLREDPGVKAKLTVLKDKDSIEFEGLKSENLRLIKSYLPIYGQKFPYGSVLISHQGNYTFSMASHDIEIEELLRLFEYAIECAWEYELGVLT
jgi:hypothetical protein